MFRFTKLLFLTLVLISGFSLNLQAQPVGEGPPPSGDAEVSADYIAGDLLWNQFNANLATASASQRFPDMGNGVLQSADDFKIPGGDSWLIEHINVRGLDSGGPFTLADIIFYDDNAGMPGNPIGACTYTDVPITDGADFSVDLPAPCLLNSGTYWVSFMVVAPFNTNGQWFWDGVTFTTLSEWQFQDPDGIIANPCVSWGDGMTDCGLIGFDKQFQLVGVTNAVAITETYCSTDVPLPISSTLDPTESVLSVPPTLLEDVIQVTVQLHITHTFDGDLEISVESPANTNVLLSDNNGGAGDNYGNDCGTSGMQPGALGMSPDSIFDDNGPTPIGDGSPPFDMGPYQPEEMLSSFDGEDATGTWTLIVNDIFGGDDGTLECWCVDITRYTPLHLDPIHPAVESNTNFMEAFWVRYGSPVAFIWGFQTGSFTVNIPCGEIELGIVPFELLGIQMAGFNMISEFAFYIALGGYANPAFTQAVDLDTCRVSPVVPNIILNTNL